MHNFLIAGIVGTLLMTGAMYLLAAITGRNYKVVGILATMVTNHTTPEKGLTKSTADIMLGIVLHYVIGIIFAFIYFQIWKNPGIVSAFAFGAITGVVAMIFWSSFFRLHPNPPAVPLPSYVPAIGTTHLIFSLGVHFYHTCISKIID